MNIEKLIELYAQNKDRAIIVGAALILILCFILGRSSVSMPSKDVLCDAEYKTIKNLNEELSTLKDVIYIDIAYAKPNEEFLNWQTLKIDSDGTSKFIQFVN